MAKFRGIVQGQRGEASRLGGKSSGIHVQANGWHMGVKVNGYVNAAGEDEFEISLTGGSSGWCAPKIIGAFTKKDLGA